MSTQDEQLKARHQLPEALDKLRDAVTEAGPNEDAHEAALERVFVEVPSFGSRLMRLVSLRAQDDTAEVTADSKVGKLVVKLVEDDLNYVIDVLQEENAHVMLEALVGLGVSARLNGLTKWKAPQED